MKRFAILAVLAGVLAGVPAAAQYPPPYPAPCPAPAYPVAPDTVLVPLVQRVYSNPDYYWSVRDYYRDANELEKNQQLSALIQALLAKQVGQDHAPAAAARQTVGHRSLGKLPAPVLRGQPVAAVRKGGDAGAYLAGACVRCHGAGRAAGGIDLSNPDAVAPADREACVEAMVDGRMPKGGAAPSLAEVAAVSKWAAGK